MKLITGIETKTNKKGRVKVISTPHENSVFYKSFKQIEEEDKLFSEEQDKMMKKLFRNIGEAYLINQNN